MIYFQISTESTTPVSGQKDNDLKQAVKHDSSIKSSRTIWYNSLPSLWCDLWFVDLFSPCSIISGKNWRIYREVQTYLGNFSLGSLIARLRVTASVRFTFWLFSEVDLGETSCNSVVRGKTPQQHVRTPSNDFRACDLANVQKDPSGQNGMECLLYPRILDSTSYYGMAKEG